MKIDTNDWGDGYFGSIPAISAVYFELESALPDNFDGIFVKNFFVPRQPMARSNYLLELWDSNISLPHAMAPNWNIGGGGQTIIWPPIEITWYVCSRPKNRKPQFSGKKGCFNNWRVKISNNFWAKFGSLKQFSRNNWHFGAILDQNLEQFSKKYWCFERFSFKNW